ncbi:Protein of uncharacterised function (DUF3170) [Serratia rubidaea]|uniref:Protein of uncharacterized function (DUF3170) n=1 Tax=Serratia rubidaea TaxID=61652 RepID=A0A4U9HD08_SERRU|nr:Protein of uncharacterised function (DUF3170) [Serratia rubidaea]
MLLIFLAVGGNNQAQLAAHQRRLQDLEHLFTAGRLAGAQRRVRLVKQQQVRHRRTTQGVNHLQQPRRKSAAVAEPCLQLRQVQSADTHIFQAVRHIAFYNALRQPLHQRTFPDARLADQDRIVFTPAGKHINDLPQFGVTPQYRIELPGLRFRGDIQGELIQQR